MLKKIREMKDEDGFTLIELMVVVLIIAILIAIALPTFLGLRQRAQDRAAQSNLRNGLAAAKAFYTDGETYTGFNAAAGTAIEPSLNWVGAGAPVAGNVHVQAASGTSAVLSAASQSGATFCIGDNAGATTYGDDAQPASAAACTGGW